MVWSRSGLGAQPELLGLGLDLLGLEPMTDFYSNLLVMVLVKALKNSIKTPTFNLCGVQNYVQS